jgi:hypothetical protein
VVALRRGDHRSILEGDEAQDEEETVVETNMDLLGWLRKQLAEAEPDLLREMVKSFAEALMGAEADALCGAAFRERSAAPALVVGIQGEQAPLVATRGWTDLEEDALLEQVVQCLLATASTATSGLYEAADRKLGSAASPVAVGESNHEQTDKEMQRRHVCAQEGVG